MADRLPPARRRRQVELIVHSNPLQVAHAPDSWMLVYTPDAETDTLAKLERLLASC
jgi:hypothetical protein